MTFCLILSPLFRSAAVSEVPQQPSKATEQQQSRFKVFPLWQQRTVPLRCVYVRVCVCVCACMPSEHPTAALFLKYHSSPRSKLTSHGATAPALQAFPFVEDANGASARVCVWVRACVCLCHPTAVRTLSTAVLKKRGAVCCCCVPVRYRKPLTLWHPWYNSSRNSRSSFCDSYVRFLCFCVCVCHVCVFGHLT